MGSGRYSKIKEKAKKVQERIYSNLVTMVAERLEDRLISDDDRRDFESLKSSHSALALKCEILSKKLDDTLKALKEVKLP